MEHKQIEQNVMHKMCAKTATNARLKKMIVRLKKLIA